MTGLFDIDTITNYPNARLFGGLGDFANLPSLKAVYSNDWWEQDGVDYDLSTPALNGYEVDLQFYSDTLASQRAFIELIKDGGRTHDFYLRDILRSPTMRFITMTSNDTQGGMYVYTLRFAIDNPYRTGYTYAPPIRPANIQNSYLSMDGINFANYGIYTLAGTKANTLQEFSAKSWLMQDDPTADGYTTLAYPANRRERSQTIEMLMVQSSVANFWINRDALLYNLVQPDYRQITSANISANAVYQSCKTVKLLLKDNGEVAWRFAITINLQPAYISPV